MSAASYTRSGTCSTSCSITAVLPTPMLILFFLSLVTYFLGLITRNTE